MTHQQQAGLAVIGVAVFLLVVLTGLRPHSVIGFAQAALVLGPPRVGDCVLNPLPDRSQGVIAVTATSGGTVPMYPAQQIQPCTGIRYGEITSVISMPKSAVVKGDNVNSRYLDDPNKDSCIPTAMQYLGMTTQLIQRFWQTYLQVSIALSRPLPHQEAAGQRWAACIVTVRPPDSASVPKTLAASQYGSSIRNALQTGELRDQLGNCIPVVDWDGGFASGGCRQPHALEMLGYGDSGDHPVNRIEVEVTCQQLVRQLTAMPDPTAAGALSVQVHVEDNDSTAITTPQIPAHSKLACAVTTTNSRKLRGSLLALGHQSIPWA